MTVRLPVIRSGTDLVLVEPFELPSIDVPDGAPVLNLSAGELQQRDRLRTSSYVIYVDLPGTSDEMLLVHGYTGAYDRVSKRVATYLRSLESHHAPKPLYGDWTPESSVAGEVVKPSDEAIATLERRGYLVKLTPEEEEALFVRVASRVHERQLRSMPQYILMPTYQCNLRCPYCFQDHMRTDPAFSHLLRVMSRSMVDRVVRGMDSLEAAHGLADDLTLPRQVVLFGGEPLLASSRPIIEYLMQEVGKQRPASFSAITNGTDLDAYRDLLGPEGIHDVQITIDGPPAEHDQRRIYADGSGSFDRIAKNVDMALSLGVTVQVRMNMDRNNIAHLPEMIDHFDRHGWLDHAGFRPYVAPIHPGNDQVNPKSTFTNWQLGRAVAALKEDHPLLAKVGTYDDSMQREASSLFHSEGAATGSPGFRSAFCSAHTTMYVIDAFADIYACWERTGEPELRVGYIEESGQVFMNRALLERWRQRSAVSNPVCRKCRYAASCGGGCAAYAESASGDLYRNFCDGYAKRFRASVARAYQAYERGELPAAEAPRLCDS